MSRSLSFNDMGSVAGDSGWKPISEDEVMVPDSLPPESSLLSGEIDPRRVPNPRTESSGMSIASMSTASSHRWMHGMNDMAMDDGHSVLSQMSADLHALDLAHRADS